MYKPGICSDEYGLMCFGCGNGNRSKPTFCCNEDGDHNWAPYAWIMMLGQLWRGSRCRSIRLLAEDVLSIFFLHLNMSQSQSAIAIEDGSINLDITYPKCLVLCVRFLVVKIQEHALVVCDKFILTLGLHEVSSFFSFCEISRLEMCSRICGHAIEQCGRLISTIGTCIGKEVQELCLVFCECRRRWLAKEESPPTWHCSHYEKGTTKNDRLDLF